MDYDQLKAGVKEISEIAASVPEQFRDKCFELLLASLLGQKQKPADPEPDPDDPLPPPPPSGTAIPVTAQLQLLMRKTHVTIAELDKVILYADNDVHFIKEPHDVAIATGQLEWALLLALKSAILKDTMVADPEAVRSICQAKGLYDKANFATNFKSTKSAKMFKSALVPQGEAQPLSSEGQTALGILIKRLASEA
jgi:hypothetical protein